MSTLDLHISTYKKNLDKLEFLKNKNKYKLKNKFSADERVNKILDNNSILLNIGTFAGWDLYNDKATCPSGGVIVKIGYIHHRIAIVIANDPTVKAGSMFPITIKKILRAQEIAIKNHIPIIYLVDSAGIYLPLQDEVFPGIEGFGRIFRNNAIISSMGILQISAIMGTCVAGGAYIPALTDESFIVENVGHIFLAGPALVKAAIGEETDIESLGGANIQTGISGVVDNSYKTEDECLKAIRKNFDKFPNDTTNVDKDKNIKKLKISQDQHKILDIFSSTQNKFYNMEEIIKIIVDAKEFNQYKKNFGQSILCGYAKINNISIGIVANQRINTKSKKGELNMGGVIYADAAKKAARFIMICNQKKIPIIFFQDVAGFMVGKKSESEGIIKEGAKLINVVSNSVVPKYTVIIGNSYGAGHYALCSTAFDPNFIFAWPSAKIGVMNESTMNKVLSKLNKKTIENYSNKTTAYYAASNMWVDEIINPLDTRYILSFVLKIGLMKKITNKFNVGIIQT